MDGHTAEIREVLLIRKTEQKLLDLFREGKVFGTVHTCIGQEFVGVSVARVLEPQDTLFSNHRGHGHFLAYCGDVVGLFAEIMGRENGVCGGKGGSQHLHCPNYYSNGVQGGIVPVAAGIAMAHKHSGTKAVSIVFIGDGTLGEGAVYETMNIASRWQLPLLIVCENNLFAQSTSQSETLAGDICERASAFGIKTSQSNTWDWNQLFEDIEQSIDYVRANSLPLFHRVDTFRLMAHSKGDDNRPREYVQEHWDRDPLVLLEATHRDDPEWQTLVKDVEREIDTAVESAEAAKLCGADTKEYFVDTHPVESSWTEFAFDRERIVHSINRSLRGALQKHPEVLLIGEDIESPYGGAFKCTAGLSDEYPGRVINTPISEQALVGIGNGLALRGMIPVVEIMFGDFLTLAADQWINHAAKFRGMFGDDAQVPLIVRTPMGGRRGYGATHSQCLEKHFLGVPDTQVLALHHRYSPLKLYEDLFAGIDRPTLVVENKVLYGQYCSSDPPAGYRLLVSGGRFPVVRMQPSVAPDLTIVVIGGMSLDAERALQQLFDEEEVICELFLPTQLYPMDVSFLEDSLQASRKLLVVEEGQGFVSIGSEIVAQIAERYCGLSVRCRRLAAKSKAIPAARPLEDQCLPCVDHIVETALEVVRNGDHGSDI